jgi:hypothetical protein
MTILAVATGLAVSWAVIATITAARLLAASDRLVGTVADLQAHIAVVEYGLPLPMPVDVDDAIDDDVDWGQQ